MIMQEKVCIGWLKSGQKHCEAKIDEQIAQTTAKFCQEPKVALEGVSTDVVEKELSYTYTYYIGKHFT